MVKGKEGERRTKRDRTDLSRHHPPVILVSLVVSLLVSLHPPVSDRPRRGGVDGGCETSNERHE